MPPLDPHIDPALADAIHRTYVRPVGEAVAAQHMAAMAAAARQAQETLPQTASAPRRRRPGTWRPALVAGIAALALPAGLAAAGVRLPGPVNAPYDAVGVELPHQEDPAPRLPERRGPTVVVPAPAVTTGPPAAPRLRTTPSPSSSSPSQERPARQRGGKERPSERGAERGVRRRGEGPLPDRGRTPDRPARPQRRARPDRPATPARPASPAKPVPAPKARGVTPPKATPPTAVRPPRVSKPRPAKSPT